MRTRLLGEGKFVVSRFTTRIIRDQIGLVPQIYCLLATFDGFFFCVFLKVVSFYYSASCSKIPCNSFQRKSIQRETKFIEYQFTRVSWLNVGTFSHYSCVQMHISCFNLRDNILKEVRIYYSFKLLQKCHALVPT